MTSSQTDSECLGARTAGVISEYMAFTAVEVNHPGTVDKGMLDTASQFFTDIEVRFGSEFDTRPSHVSYVCEFTCGECLGKVALDVKGELAEIMRARECSRPDVFAAITLEALLNDETSPGETPGQQG